MDRSGSRTNSPLDSQEAFAQSIIRKLRDGMPPTITDADLEESVENALTAEAARNEETIGGLRVAFLALVATLDLVLRFFGAPTLTHVIFTALAAGGAFLFYRKLRKGWYHPRVRKLVPIVDACIVAGAFAVDAASRPGTLEGLAFASSAIACAFLAFSGALRLSKTAVKVSTGLAVVAWALVVLTAGRATGFSGMFFDIAFVTGALLGTGYLGAHVTRTIRRVVMNEVGRTRFATLFTEAQAAIQAREEVLGIVSHDLKNPIHTISITSELLMLPDMGGLPEHKRQDYLHRIHRTAGSMNRLISALFDVARMEAGKVNVTTEPLGCSDLLGEVADQMTPLAADRQLELRMMCPENAPVVLADRVRIIQVFSNLIGNAIKFTPAGGTICVQAQRVGGRVRFSVSDTGPGIPVELRGKIFERLWQADRSDGRGLGLGLAIAKAIVEAHGGRIELDPQTTQGTTFYFTLRTATSTDAGAGI